MSFRAFTSALTAALIGALMLLLPPLAGAVPGGGSTGRTDGPGDPGSRGGGVNAGAPVTFFELRNTDHKKLLYPSNKNINKIAEIASVNRTKAAKKINNLLLSRCDAKKYWKQEFCPLWKDVSKSLPDTNNKVWFEIHTNRPDGGYDQDRVVAGWNVKVWRQNPRKKKFNLIFERRVGLNDGNDADPRNIGWSSIHKRWWYGGITNSAKGRTKARAGGTYSNTGYQKAGMIGTPSNADERSCKNNFSHSGNGKRKGVGGGKRVKSEGVRVKPNSGNWCYWEGKQIGPKYFRWGARCGKPNQNDPFGVCGIQEKYNRPENLPRDQFGSSAGGRPNKGNSDLGVTGKGLKEAIMLRWKLGNRHPRLSYRIEGAPGLIYVVQVVGIDTRERILGLAGKDTKHGQFLHGFVSKPLPNNRKTCESHPSDCKLDINEPDVDVSLDPETPLQTREESEQGVSLSIPDQLEVGQVVFPYDATLIHFTPQLRYSAAKIAGEHTYDTDYASYGAPRELVVRQTSPINSPPPRLTSGYRIGDLDQVRLRSGAWANPSADMDAVMSTDLLSNSGLDFNITWLRPTLSNPCVGTVRLPKAGKKDNWRWPADPSTCGAKDLGRVNAWDDLLSARASWEARWSKELIDPSKGASETGRVDNQLLRCADSGKDVPADECKHDFYALLQGALNREHQWAQGYLPLAAGGNDGRASARVMLDTNRPGRVGDVSVFERGVGNAYSVNPIPRRNNNTGRLVLELCDQGMPPNARYMKQGGGQAKVPANWRGDADCRGYGLEWKWNESSCSSQETAPGSFPLPGLAGLNAGDRQRAERWGDYTDPGLYAEPHHPAYNPDRVRQGTAPFFGARPASNGNPGHCEGKSFSGRYTKGSWHRTYSFKRLPATNAANCVFTDEQARELIASGAPNSSSEPAQASKCSIKADGEPLYSFGYWYPTEIDWRWDKQSCRRNVTRAETELAEKRDQGRFNSSPPPRTGMLGRSADNLVTNDGPKPQNPASFAKQYFQPEAWSCTGHQRGYLQRGRWIIKRDADSGWGKRNSAGALPVAADSGTGYIVSFEFDMPNVRELRDSTYAAEAPIVDQSPNGAGTCPMFRNRSRPGTCWRLRASYDGFTNRRWYFSFSNSPLYSAESSAYIKVFAPRSDR